MKKSAAEIIQEYGPLSDIEQVGGVTYDGENVWVAVGNRLQAIDPASGEQLRSIDMAAQAGTAYDGRYLYQIADTQIRRIDPASGQVLASIGTPSEGCSGLAWAEGCLWVGQYRERKIHQIDAATGKHLRTLESNRFVTGVTWLDGQLWHGTWEDEQSELRRLNPETGEVLEQIDMPPGLICSGLESNGIDRFFCGGGNSGKVRVVRRPA